MNLPHSTYYYKPKNEPDETGAYRPHRSHH